MHLEGGMRRGDRDQSIPLLVGLLDSSAVRRSLDIPLGGDDASEYLDIDLDELAAKQASGGGMLNSIANMANSILGAGACSSSLFQWHYLMMMLVPFFKESSVCHS
jgi:hypothetical protein